MKQVHYDGGRFYGPNQPQPESIVEASLTSKNRKNFLLACKRRAIAEMESVGEPAVAWSSFAGDVMKWEGEGELYSTKQIAMFTTMAMMNMESMSKMKYFIEGFN